LPDSGILSLVKTAKISQDLVQKIARLAALNPTQKQLQTYQDNLDEIISYMDEVKNLNLESVPETARVLEEENIFRDDEVKTENMFSQKEALANASRTYQGYFVVDKILENKEE